MIVLVLIELALILAASLAFIAFFGDPRRQADPTIAWHLWCFAVFAAMEAGALLALGVGLPVPVAVFALGYGGQAVVAVWRLILVIQGRRKG